jgi:hypothetical protein
MRVRDPAVCQPTTAVRPAAPTHLKVPPASLRRVLDRGWSARFDGLQVTGDQHGHTAITGLVADQAALHGRRRCAEGA